MVLSGLAIDLRDIPKAFMQKMRPPHALLSVDFGRVRLYAKYYLIKSMS
jgi:hypothetical protein